MVLVGGQSRRFGRDKLREPRACDAILVDAPIGALRSVFGSRVAACGECVPMVRDRADLSIDDLYPGAGPLGGIVSALLAARAGGQDSVFVLAGDLPGVSNKAVLAVLAAASLFPDAAAVVAQTDRLQPCIALYRATAFVHLAAGLCTGAQSTGLVGVVSSLGAKLAACPIDPRQAANANTPQELAAFDSQAGA